MQFARGLELVTVGDVVAFHSLFPHPLAVHPVVPAVVARGAEVKTRGAAAVIVSGRLVPSESVRVMVPWVNRRLSTWNCSSWYITNNE
jgi:hypothetical protein